jgi:ADP-ribosylglycohydrolase
MSRLTHPGVESADACRYLAGLLIGALRGESKQRLLADLYSPVYNYWLFQLTALTPRIDRIARGEYQHSAAADVPASASPADTLESALWAFASSQDFAAGLQAASSIGGATRLRGAVYGQLAGAYYGYESIPAEQRAGIADPNGIERAAGALLRHTANGIRHFTSWEKRQPGTSAES